MHLPSGLICSGCNANLLPLLNKDYIFVAYQGKNMICSQNIQPH